MTDKEKIRAEVYRRFIEAGKHDGVIAETREDELSSILSFIDSMQEVSQVKESAKTQHIKVMCKENGNSLTQEPTIPDIVDEHFYEMLGEEPVSEDLEGISEDVEELGNNLTAAAERYAQLYEREGVIHNNLIKRYTTKDKINAFKAGVLWQKEHLWKLADGNDLPEIDREVIALLDNGKVVFAHRPPEYWDGKDIVTGKVTRHYPKTYDKGGWNIPNVKYWLDVNLPKQED